MDQLLLEWFVQEQRFTYKVSFQETKTQDVIRIGRDSNICDVVLSHPDPAVERTVSRVHGEIFNDSATNRLLFRNPTRDRFAPAKPNPVFIDGQEVVEQDVPIQAGTMMQFGHVLVYVVDADAASQKDKPQRKIKCSNVSNPHYWNLDHPDLGLTCPVCGFNLIGATIVLSK